MQGVHTYVVFKGETGDVYACGEKESLSFSYGTLRRFEEWFNLHVSPERGKDA